MKIFAYLLISIFLFFGCAQDLTVMYQESSAQTGTVIIKPSRRTYQTSVTMNDQLLVDHQNIRSLSIENVPIGEHQIHYITNSQNFQEKLDAYIDIDMNTESEITKLIEVPPYNNLFYVYQILSIILPFTLLLIMIL